MSMVAVCLVCTYLSENLSRSCLDPRILFVACWHLFWRSRSDSVVSAFCTTVQQWYFFFFCACRSNKKKKKNCWLANVCAVSGSGKDYHQRRRREEMSSRVRNRGDKSSKKCAEWTTPPLLPPPPKSTFIHYTLLVCLVTVQQITPKIPLPAALQTQFLVFGSSVTNCSSLGRHLGATLKTQEFFFFFSLATKLSWPTLASTFGRLVVLVGVVVLVVPFMFSGHLSSPPLSLTHSNWTVRHHYCQTHFTRHWLYRLPIINITTKCK